MNAEPTSDSLVSSPDRVGDYRLVRRLEHDDFASIWEAERSSRVRLIQLNAELADDQELETAFVQHADTMASVDCPGILRVLDSATEGGTSFMVTEQVEGASLAELVLASPDQRLPVAISKRILIETCEVLRAIHALPGAAGSSQLIHGDVTPHALFVTSEGDVMLVPTCLGTVSCRAPRGSRSGRLAYKAPEQLAGSSDIDARADVFAVGVTFWAALCGASPFRGASAEELVRAVQAGAPTTLPPLGSEPADSMLSLLARALRADKNARLQDCSELESELERLGGAASHDELAALAKGAMERFHSGSLERESDPWRIRLPAPSRSLEPDATPSASLEAMPSAPMVATPSASLEAMPTAPTAAKPRVARPTAPADARETVPKPTAPTVAKVGAPKRVPAAEPKKTAPVVTEPTAPIEGKREPVPANDEPAADLPRAPSPTNQSAASPPRVSPEAAAQRSPKSEVSGRILTVPPAPLSSRPIVPIVGIALLICVVLLGAARIFAGGSEVKSATTAVPSAESPAVTADTFSALSATPRAVESDRHAAQAVAATANAPPTASVEPPAVTSSTKSVRSRTDTHRTHSSGASRIKKSTVRPPPKKSPKR